MSSDKPTAGPYISGRPIPQEWQGKCFTCGFLRLFVPTEPEPEYREINIYVRAGLQRWLDRVDSDKYQPWPKCLMDIRDFESEIPIEAAQQSEPGQFERAARIVLWQDPKCLYWQPFLPGKAIQQYHAEVSLQELEKLRQQFHEDRERSHETFLAEMDARREVFNKKRFEAEQRVQEYQRSVLESIRDITADSKQIALDSKGIAADNRSVVAAIKEIAEKSDRFSRRVTLWIIFLGVIQTLSSLVALYLGYLSLRASNSSALLDALERLLTR